MPKQATEGFRELALAMRELPKQLQRQGLRAGTLAAAIVVRDAARQLAPVRTGVLRSAIIVKYRPEESSNSKAVYIVTVRRGKNEVSHRRVTGFDVTTGQKFKYKMDVSANAYYWSWVEFGKHIKHHQAAEPFMRPAFANNVDRVIDTMREVIADKLPSLVAAARRG